MIRNLFTLAFASCFFVSAIGCGGDIGNTIVGAPQAETEPTQEELDAMSGIYSDEDLGVSEEE